MNEQEVNNNNAAAAPAVSNNPGVGNGNAPTPAPAANPSGPAQTQGNGDNGGGTLLTGNPKPAEQGTAGKTPAANVSYDLSGSIPKDSVFEFSKEEQDKFVDVIKDMNLSNEQANAIAKYGFDWAQGIVNSIGDALRAERQEWGDAAVKELGADKDKVLSAGGAAIEYLEKSIPGLRQALNETGAGNRIELVRAFAKMGELIASDPGKAAVPGGAVPKTSALYPNTDFSRYME